MRTDRLSPPNQRRLNPGQSHRYSTNAARVSLPITTMSNSLDGTAALPPKITGAPGWSGTPRGGGGFIRRVPSPVKPLLSFFVTAGGMTRAGLYPLDPERKINAARRPGGESRTKNAKKKAPKGAVTGSTPEFSADFPVIQGR